MSEYTAQVTWQRESGAAFIDNRYSRRHSLHFDGGVVLAASSSPHVVPLPWSDPQAVDPEEMFVASLASCHLLWFLSIAAAQGWVVDHYCDPASGTLARQPAGADRLARKLVMTQVVLRPQVRFAGLKQPSAAEFEALHHQAHDECFIANSVTAQVLCQPVLLPPA
jgi:organic hydroperoxide reductase OsmC/OhrA